MAAFPVAGTHSEFDVKGFTRTNLGLDQVMNVRSIVRMDLPDDHFQGHGRVAAGQPEQAAHFSGAGHGSARQVSLPTSKSGAALRFYQTSLAAAQFRLHTPLLGHIDRDDRARQRVVRVRRLQTMLT